MLKIAWFSEKIDQNFFFIKFASPNFFGWRTKTWRIFLGWWDPPYPLRNGYLISDWLMTWKHASSLAAGSKLKYCSERTNRLMDRQTLPLLEARCTLGKKLMFIVNRSYLYKIWSWHHFIISSADTSGRTGSLRRWSAPWGWDQTSCPCWRV